MSVRVSVHVCVLFGGNVETSFCPHFLKLDVHKFKKFWILGEKQWKEGAQIKKNMKKGCKIVARKKNVFGQILPFWGFFSVSLCLTVFLTSFLKVQCPNFLDFRNPWGKVMKSGLRLKNFTHKGCKIVVAKKSYRVFFICSLRFNFLKFNVQTI